MSRLIKSFLVAGVAALVFTACDKVKDLPYYNAGATPVLTSSATVVAPALADSNNTVLTLSWTDPKYAAVDTSTEKYVVQLDTAGRNFLKAIQYTVTGRRQFAITGKTLTNALVAAGYALNMAHDINVRVIASHANNNEQFFSNILTVKMTPYAVPFNVTASNAGPLSITIQNKDNVIETFSWHSPSYPNSTFTYKLEYDTAGAGFANAKTIIATTSDSVAAIKGVDMNNYAKAAGIAEGTQGALDFRVVATINGIQKLASAPKTIRVTPNALLAVLHVAGDYQGWNPGAAPLLASTDAVSYEGYVNISTTGGFKLTNQPNWDGTNYGDGGANKLSTSGGNLNVPAPAYYLLKANLNDLTWSATATTWGIIGAATPGGWNSSTPFTFDAATNTWVIPSIALAADEFKFRANNAWDINLGGDPAKLSYGGSNLKVAQAGNYKVVLNLSVPLSYAVTLTKL